MLPKAYLNSSLLKKIELQRKINPNIKPICLFSDLDDSYVIKYWPSEDVLKKYSQKYTDTILYSDIKFYNPTIALKKYLDQHNIPLVIVSGRDIYQISELKKSFAKRLPQYSEIMDFDAIIGAIGTEIYIKHNNKYQLDLQYQRLLKKTSFNRRAIYEVLEKLMPVVKNKFHPLSFDFSKRDKINSVNELPKQLYKVSLEFKSDSQTSEKIMQIIKTEFKKNNLSEAKLLLSCPYNINSSINKYNLDIVPFSKDKPISYLRSLLNITTIVAADSGNDFDMITKSADYAIVVGNAKKELISSIENLIDHEKKHIFLVPLTLSGPDAILYATKNYLDQIIVK